MWQLGCLERLCGLYVTNFLLPYAIYQEIILFLNLNLWQPCGSAWQVALLPDTSHSALESPHASCPSWQAD